MTAGNDKWASWKDVKDSELGTGWCDSNAIFRKARYRLGIADDIMLSVYSRPKPWYRFWQRVLLGWKWEAIMD